MTFSPFKFIHPAQRTIPLVVGCLFLLIAVLCVLISILSINNEKFIYCIDDPYIHLALAEHIRHWHYGLNAGEFCAPSSSILWPFIIAPFSSWDMFPFLINFMSALLTVFVFYKILDKSFSINEMKIRSFFLSFLLILLIAATNMIGLIFTGMEHSLQVLIVAIIAYGLILEVEDGIVKPWFITAIIAAPLIRYEDLAISFAAILYLLLRKYYRSSIVSIFLITLFVGGFSAFLIHLGLGALPASIMVKSSIMENAGKLHSIISNLHENFRAPIGKFMVLGIIGLLAFFLLERKNSKQRLLTVCTIFAIILHLLVGRYGYLNRYEIYIWTFLLLIGCFLFSKPIVRIIDESDRACALMKVALLGSLFVAATCFDYIIDLFTIPIASNNTYEQQYQMHRFAVDYYNKPIAVNDLGVVSYKNKNYVLDLWGLGSREALKLRHSHNENSNWMNTLAQAKDVNFAMIYDEWFKVKPVNWINVGTLYLGKKQCGVACKEVSFYAFNPKAYREIVPELQLFQKTLPADVIFRFAKEPSDSMPKASGFSNRL